MTPEMIGCDWDVLGWWRLTGTKRYPQLSKMAKDILCIQATSLVSESQFSTSGRVIDDYRSRLDPITVRMLMLLKSWLDAFQRNKRWEKKKPHSR